MSITKKVLTDTATGWTDLAPQEEAIKAQKEQIELNFRHDCRRTAMQLASRNGSSDATNTIIEAEKLYNWLIDVK